MVNTKERVELVRVRMLEYWALGGGLNEIQVYDWLRIHQS
jgi:hypothetical protein